MEQKAGWEGTSTTSIRSIVLIFSAVLYLSIVHEPTPKEQVDALHQETGRVHVVSDPRNHLAGQVFTMIDMTTTEIRWSSTDWKLNRAFKLSDGYILQTANSQKESWSFSLSKVWPR